MTQVRQTIMRAPLGNCFQACVASVFELPLEQVPDFAKLRQESRAPWMTHLAMWLKDRGLAYALLDAKVRAEPPSGYGILVGEVGNDRSIHSVVFLNGVKAWDPSPTPRKIDDYKYYMMFVALDPARLRVW